jgi:sugar-specific transcriptional regulator TrmB
MLQWNTLLKTLGFTDSESKIYLISLEMGPSSVQDIAKKANVSRVTTYAVIESLAKHGLMSTTEKGKKTLYSAESPERLVSFVNNRMKEMENTLREVQSSINELKLIQHGDKPVVKMFEGKEGFKAIQDDILKTAPDTILEMSNFDSMRQHFKREELTPFVENLDKKNIKAEAIIASTIPFMKRALTNIHNISIEDHPFFGNITVYANKVALSSFQGKNITVLIESEIIAQTMREMFHLAVKGIDGKK